MSTYIKILMFAVKELNVGTGGDRFHQNPESNRLVITKQFDVGRQAPTSADDFMGYTDILKNTTA
jgi:hypothetical protein